MNESDYEAEIMRLVSRLAEDNKRMKDALSIIYQCARSIPMGAEDSQQYYNVERCIDVSLAALRGNPVT